MIPDQLITLSCQQHNTIRRRGHTYLFTYDMRALLKLEHALLHPLTIRIRYTNRSENAAWYRLHQRLPLGSPEIGNYLVAALGFHVRMVMSAPGKVPGGATR
ncbi:hypothetical protein Zmor_025070 [Zophobas morio]|uniref:Uncharacterized protein n=1 Tax=Zophobas morio TaxID=2755281 RepID=A0AA38HW21_9CUCU|nr:hypothetical protein Zmor_025070 [Zophobas morio]